VTLRLESTPLKNLIALEIKLLALFLNLIKTFFSNFRSSLMLWLRSWRYILATKIFVYSLKRSICHDTSLWKIQPSWRAS